eukprot:7513276-Pyramimonas_sp.AAC.1
MAAPRRGGVYARPDRVLLLLHFPRLQATLPSATNRTLFPAGFLAKADQVPAAGCRDEHGAIGAIQRPARRHRGPQGQWRPSRRRSRHPFPHWNQTDPPVVI